MTTPPQTGTLTYSQLKGVWLQASKGTRYHSNAWASLMAAIAEAESGGDPLATNPTDNNGAQTSWGLWQVSDGTHAEPAQNWATPTANAKLAIDKLDSQGLTAWGTYTSGAYKGFLSDKTAADLTAAVGPSHVETAAATTAAKTKANCLLGTSIDNPIPSWVPLVGGGSASICFLSRSQARAVMGAALLLGGLLVMNVGAGWIIGGPAITAQIVNVAGGRFKARQAASAPAPEPVTETA